jgi:hypothetical protein
MLKKLFTKRPTNNKKERKPLIQDIELKQNLLKKEILCFIIT